MKLWIVIYGDDWQAGHWVYGIYDTKDKATQALSELKIKFPYEAYVKEYILNTILDNYQ